MAELVSIKRNVDVSPGQAAPAVFHCSQGDVGSKIILGLLNNGTAYSIPSGVTVTIEGSESNGSIFTPISATASGSDITFYLTGEMTAVAGPAICQAVLKSGSNILGTANFTLEVESSPMGADAPPVFTDAGWTWMLNKLTTEFVPALGDNIIDAIDGKADQSDLTALSNTVAGHTGSITVLNNTVNNLNQSVTENRQNISRKLDKNQGTANAGKYLKVGADGNVTAEDLDVTTDKTLSIADKAADAKAVGDELTDLRTGLNDLNEILTETEDLTSSFTSGYYHSTAQSKGKITPNNLVEGEQWSYIFREVHKGEKYVVTAYSSTASARAYCLTNALYVPVLLAPSPRSAVDFAIAVEADGYLVINNNSNLQTSPKLLKVTDNLEKISKSVSALQDSVSATEQDILNINNDISSLQESEGKTTDLTNGYALLSDLFDFKIGRWGLEVSPSAAAHSSTVIARTLNAVSVQKPTAIICDLGYRFYNVISSSDEGASWAVESERICTIMLTPGKLYRLNAQYINQATLTDTNEVTTHIKVLDVITSEYEKYKSTFFGFEMYNKVAFVGDSYSMKRSTYNKCWGQIIGQKCGIEVNLFGHSGYTTNTFRNATGSGDSLTGMLAASANDLYWLGFGINDAAGAKQNPDYVGNAEDLSGSYTEYPNTFWGNYGCIIESIRTTFPNAKIVLCNVMYHDMTVMQSGSDTVNIPLINTALIGIAEHYGVPLINLMDDVFYKSPEYDSNMQATAYTHPDPILFPGMANANMRLFSKAVSDYPAYFKTSTADN